jgi:RimJ/RimL family protein N-acetyltransferase
MLNTEIINAKQKILNEEEIKGVVEIECHPKVREWLFEYVDKSVQKEFQAYKRFFKKLKKNRRAEILVAKCNGHVAGFLGLWRQEKYKEHVATLGVSVHPDYWGNGVATHLIESAVELAKDNGFIRLEIETMAENKAMRHVAEKEGFKLESLRKNRIFKDGEFHDEASYCLLLDNGFTNIMSSEQDYTAKVYPTMYCSK